MYQIVVFVKPNNKQELDDKLSKLSKERDNERSQIIDSAYQNNMRLLETYLRIHAIGDFNLMGRLHWAICKMATKDILNLRSQEYVQNLCRGDL